MKRILVPAALCFLAAGPLAFAQAPQTTPDQQPPAPITRPNAAENGPGGPHGRHHQPSPHRQALMLSRRLNLTPDQTAKLEPILADREQKIAALRANTSLTPEDRHQQMQALHEQEKTQLATLLTPEQQEQLKSMRHGRRGPNHDRPDPAAAL